MSNEELSKLYFGNLYDFSNENDVHQLQERNRDLVLNDKPVFSFMMCVYNDMSLFNSAVNSLLKQRFTDWELVILDNSDSNPMAWEIICNAVKADPRIRAYKSEKNVGWPKGASILLQYVKGEYTTFLAADDCINFEALEWIYKEIVNEGPDIIWVGNIYVNRIADEKMGYINQNIPSHRVIKGEGINQSEIVFQIMSTVYYNSFFHYMKVAFLKEQGIDFFEPYYADCAGMTRAMVKAGSMVILDKPVYALTLNTSQTVGRYTWGSWDYIFCSQWRSVCEIFQKEQDKNVEQIGYVSERILNNLIGNIATLCQANCRDKYMRPVEKSTNEIIAELESCLASDEVGEMFLITGSQYFEKLLDALAHFTIPDIEKYKGSWIYPCLALALYREQLSIEQFLAHLFDWLLQENNTRCIGFDYGIAILNELDDSVLIPYYADIQKLIKKYDKAAERLLQIDRKEGKI